MPRAAGRPRFTKRGFTYYGKKDAEYRKELDAFFSQFRGGPSTLPCKLFMHFVLPPYKTSTYPIPRVDLDNLMKAVMDAMTRCGAFWQDDHQVVELIATKEFGGAPRTDVKLETLNEESL